MFFWMSTKRIDVNTIFEEEFLKLFKDSGILKEDDEENINLPQRIDKKSAEEKINLLLYLF